MAPKFDKFFQIGIIVRDRDAAVKFYEEKLGMGPWEIAAMDGTMPHMADFTIDGKPMQCLVAKTAFLHAYGFEIELIEPIADTPYKRWLDEHGPGLHHIAVNVADGYDETIAELKAANGKEPWIHGVGIGGLMDFSYLDLREETGLIVECYRNIQPGKIWLDY